MNANEFMKQVDFYKKGKCKYTWDELEELATNAFDEEKLTSEQYDEIMECLMAVEAREDESDNFSDEEDWE